MVEEAGQDRGRRDRWDIAQMQVHAYAEPARVLRELYGLGKGLAVRQQRRAGHNPMAMRLRDTPVHPRSPAEVIRIYDQVSGHLYCSFTQPCPLGQLHSTAP